MRHTALALIAACALAGCTDPVQSDRVSALGGEIQQAGRRGPGHRPGQPCTYCHGGQGPGKTIFDLAGTVFQTPDPEQSVLGVDDVEIQVMDAAGVIRSTTPYEHGNFYWQEGELGLEFPLRARIRQAGGSWIEMTTPIFRARSCAECHAGAGPSSVRRIFISEAP